MVRKRKIRTKVGLLLLLLLLLASVFHIGKCLFIYGSQLLTERNFASRTATPLLEIDSNPVFPSGCRLHSPYAILVRLDDHTVLMGKNSEAKIYPASLTKMMTAITAIENMPNLYEEIELSENIFHHLTGADATMAGFWPDEQVRAIDLLYGVLLPSGAECCMGLAEYIAGSEEEYVRIMNQKAAALGMADTHFENTTGLHQENHYTTVKDMAILLDYAVQDDIFWEIFTSSRYSTAPTNKHPEGITFYSTLFQNLSDPSISAGEIIGGKTGYTDKAGLCLASLASLDNNEYILVTAGATGNHDSEPYHIYDALEVYNGLGEDLLMAGI